MFSVRGSAFLGNLLYFGPSINPIETHFYDGVAMRDSDHGKKPAKTKGGPFNSRAEPFERQI
jgi:hypothetical protein